MRDPGRFVQVSTTVDNEKTANKIANTLLEKRLASCIQVLGPVKSSYWWKGKIEHAREWCCLIKARTRDYRSIERTIRAEHPYDVPEILAFSVVSGHSAYLEWICKETKRSSGSRS